MQLPFIYILLVHLKWHRQFNSITMCVHTQTCVLGYFSLVTITVSVSKPFFSLLIKTFSTVQHYLACILFLFAVLNCRKGCFKARIQCLNWFLIGEMDNRLIKKNTDSWYQWPCPAINPSAILLVYESIICWYHFIEVSLLDLNYMLQNYFILIHFNYTMDNGQFQL